jgi:accessory colonization factor AcfC
MTKREVKNKVSFSMKRGFKISSELLLKAAKFAQNHKIKSNIIWFEPNSEAIVFLDENDSMIAWVDYNNPVCGKQYWIRKENKND